MANEKEKTELKKNEGSQYMLWTEVKNYKVLAYIYVYIRYVGKSRTMSTKRPPLFSVPHH